MNKKIFKTGRAGSPPTDTTNLAGGNAYSLEPRAALAQLAVTGCFGDTFYASAEAQLEEILRTAELVEPAFVAKCAAYARRRGHMKDAPAVLVAHLASRAKQDRAAASVLKAAFRAVVDNGKMLRNFVQAIRSGVTGRKSLGTRPKNLIEDWLANRTDEQIFRDSVGNDPSLADVIKMVHPKPKDAGRACLYAYLIGKPVKAPLPTAVTPYELFKAYKKIESRRDIEALPVPNVPFQLLDSLNLTGEEWGEVAANARWTMTRMNLNTFARHGVFKIPGMAKKVADRLRDPEEVARAKAFPYQLMVAYANASDDVPVEVKESLQDAMEHATKNVPTVDGNVTILVDVSGSMKNPITGARGAGTSKVRCVDVAALITSCLLRNNKTAEVIPFENAVVSLKLNPRDSVVTNAQKLAAVGGGGTNMGAGMAAVDPKKADLVVVVSDNESWMDFQATYRGTKSMQEWDRIKKRNSKARLACIDLSPNATTQAKERRDVLNVGGFSDAVFEILGEFAASRLNKDHFVGVVEAVDLDEEKSEKGLASEGSES